MAELLVRVVDKANPDDLYKDVKLTKRGDVIVTAEDGWQWGIEELKNPAWRIIKLPGVKVADVSFLTDAEPDPRPVETRVGAAPPTLQRRRHKFDVDSALLPVGIRNAIADDSRRVPAIAIPPRFDVATVVSRKPAVQDPDVFEVPIDVTPGPIGRRDLEVLDPVQDGDKIAALNTQLDAVLNFEIPSVVVPELDEAGQIVADPVDPVAVDPIAVDVAAAGAELP
jgi:hypothetical protein